MNYKVFKRIIRVFLALIFAMSFTAMYASEEAFQCKISYNSEKAAVVLEGVSASSVTVYVYNNKINPDVFSETNMPEALWQFDIMREESFTFEVPLSPDMPSGVYVAKVSNAQGAATYTFTHLNEASVSEALSDINKAISESDEKIADTFLLYADDLLVSEADALKYKDILGKILYGRNKKIADAPRLMATISECFAIYDVVNCLDADRESMLLNNLDNLSVSDEKYTQLSGDAKNFVLSRLASDNGYIKESFESYFEKLMALAAVKYAQKWQDIKVAVTETYEDIIGINEKISDAVFRKMANMTYAEFEDIMENYLKAKEKKTVSTPSGGSSGGSSAGSGGSPVIGGSSSSVQKTEQNNENKILVSFSDMADDHWAMNAVCNLVEKGVLSGYPDGSFKPESNITRSEFVKMIATAFNITGVSELPFEDVESSAWYADYLKAAYKNGIISGVSSSHFMPDSYITREDACLIIYRIIKDKLSDKNENKFDDENKISDYALVAVNTLYANKIISGVSEGIFSPKSFIDRQSAAVLINNCLK